MKTFAFIICYIVLMPFCYGQEMPFDTLLNRAKAEFAKDFDAQDYGAAIKYLNSAIELNPKNAEAHRENRQAFASLPHAAHFRKKTNPAKP